MPKKYDYEKLDKAYHFTYRQEKIELAKKLGYTYISEGIVEVYRKTKSQRKTGKIFGYFDKYSIRRVLNFIGEPTNPPGGFRPGDKRHGKPAYTRVLPTTASNPNYQPFL